MGQFQYHFGEGQLELWKLATTVQKSACLPKHTGLYSTVGELDLRSRCLAIDLEVGKQSGELHRFAAIRGDLPDRPLVYSGAKLREGLRELDAMAAGAKYVVGHNLIAFDLPQLRAVAPDSALFSLPAIDTLRLSPLAFPRNPYHRLVKHYKEARLLRTTPSDPELDSRLCLELLAEEVVTFQALAEENPALLAAYQWLCGKRSEDAGFAAVFSAAGGQSCPGDLEGLQAVTTCFGAGVCVNEIKTALDFQGHDGWTLAYALAWLSVAGGNSVVPPWVRHEFPGTNRLLRQLRDKGCDDPACTWCLEHHNPKRVLKQWFGFSEFRPEPACEDGRPMQEAIVEAAMRGNHVLGILPTGTGKSVCYQVPALSRYENTGALTVVISPLVALMADQVHGLEARGISACAALNGLLSMPERADILDKVRLGDIAILLVSPEQLRNRGFRKAVEQREIGAWILDEAHCLSKWGQDFRTDYRYVSRFIKESAGTHPLPPVLCLTATAKPDVVADIRGHFLHVLGIDLQVFNGGARRHNLDFVVVETTAAQKLSDIHQLMESHLPHGEGGGAIVYCATRRQTEQVAQALAAMGWPAAHFHAGLQPESKKQTQRQFITGTLRVIVATNAFGMGIDKPDVRLVVHADIPGSLENYVQEAGRAGRDQLAARCVLLYCEEDIEQQFGLSALSRLPHHEIQAVLRALRRMAGKHRSSEESTEVVATPGEILAEDEENEFMRDSATDDTRVKTAISWLEQAKLLAREENRYEVFPSSMRVLSLEEIDKRLASVEMPYRGQLRAIAHLLLMAEPTNGVSTDELMGASRLSSSGVARAMHDLERVGVLSNDTVFTALVHAGVENSSRQRMRTATAMEIALIDTLRELAPDLEKGSSSVLFLRRAAQHMKNAGFAQAVPEVILRLLQGLESDGRSEADGIGSVRLRKLDAEAVQVTLQRDWEPLRLTAERRRAAAGLILDHLIGRVPTGVKGLDLLAETTFGQLNASVESDLALKSQIKDICRLVEAALLWLGKQEVLRLGRGLTVFRPAMTIQVAPGGSQFTRSDYAELQDHYNEQVVQIHVMAEYARRGLQTARDAVQLAADYFTLSREEFIRNWFPQAAKDLTRQTTNESWRNIVETLNRVQRDIVTDDRQQTNVLVLAGPGSGKTRVLVHRIAYLVRARREKPKEILALAYNRHAAAEIRRRLRELIGEDAKGVTVLTSHALAMRLTGHSFADRNGPDLDFKQVLADAVALLKGNGLLPEDADGQRERLLAGFRWILIDEYQDIDPGQYELVSALAGRTLNDPDRRLTLFAVGDDDQNVYGFAGASVEFIRQFQSDYRAKPEYLVANYRSTANLIEAANALIECSANRMKAENPITIDDARSRHAKGGTWETHDPFARGRVQVLNVSTSLMIQAEVVMRELQRLASLDPEWDWATVAVIARQWRILDPIQAYCEAHCIPVQRADDDAPQFWRLRETQALVAWLLELGMRPLSQQELDAWLAEQDGNLWWNLLGEAAQNYRLECGDTSLPAAHFREWLAEWGREVRRRQQGLLLLTAHRAKGLEFDHVAVLDGKWDERAADEDVDAARRLYYVAMTRARKTLTLASMSSHNELINPLTAYPSVFWRDLPEISTPTPGLERRYEVLSLREVDLGYAGRMEYGYPIHQAIDALCVGDPLQLVLADSRWYLHDIHGRRVGRLAKEFTPPSGLQCVKATVHAVVVWTSKDGDPAFESTYRSSRWEVLLPKLTFEK